MKVDERFTSKIASRVVAESGMKFQVSGLGVSRKVAKAQRERKRALIDTISATLILQTYMEMWNLK